MDELVETYFGITVALHRVSQDLLERLFLASGALNKRRTTLFVEIMKLKEKLKNLQVAKWSGRFRTDDDYFPINNMDYTIVAQTEEDFTPYSSISH
uniref:Uncharacterized protein n=1 Tax=Glossina morsitans morsitans TaxID=37546 RepID=A0ABK9NG48_GLOMM